MGDAIKRVKLRGDGGEIEVDAFFDTGSSYSHISEEIADIIKPKQCKDKRDLNPFGCQSTIEDKQEYEIRVIVDDLDDRCAGNTEAFIWDESVFKKADVPEQAIIGHRWMQKVGIYIEEKDGKVEVKCKSKGSVIRHMR